MKFEARVVVQPEGGTLKADGQLAGSPSVMFDAVASMIKTIEVPDEVDEKPRILALYLNVAEFGPNLWGVEAASRHYFQRSAARISLDQAALLVAAGLFVRGAWNASTSEPNSSEVSGSSR